jgi:hypothetical protein
MRPFLCSLISLNLKNKTIEIKAKKKFFFMLLITILYIVAFSRFNNTLGYEAFLLVFVSLVFCYKTIWMLSGKLQLHFINNEVKIVRFNYYYKNN